MFNFNWQWGPIHYSRLWYFNSEEKICNFNINISLFIWSMSLRNFVYVLAEICYYKKPLICYRVIFKKYNLKNHKIWIGSCSEKYHITFWIQNWNLPCHLMAFVHQDKFHVLGSTVPKLLSPFGILLAQCGLKSLLAVNIDIF